MGYLTSKLGIEMSPVKYQTCTRVLHCALVPHSPLTESTAINLVNSHSHSGCVIGGCTKKPTAILE